MPEATNTPATADTNTEQITELLKSLDTSVLQAIAQSKGLIAKTEDEYKKEIGQITKNVHETWEQKIANATNQTKPNGTKGLDWLESVLKPVTQQEPAQTQVQPQSTQESALLDQLTREMQSLKQQLADKEVQGFRNMVNATLENSLPEISAPDNIKKEEAPKWVEAQKKLLKFSFNEDYIAEPFKDGGLIFKNKAGDYMLGNNGKPLTAQQIIQNDYSYLFPTAGHQATGAGLNKSNLRNNSAYLGETKEEVEANLRSKGLVYNSREWIKAVQDHTKLVQSR